MITILGWYSELGDLHVSLFGLIFEVSLDCFD